MNISYELAKELRDAGFPFKIGVNAYGEGIHLGNTILYCPPTLEELIEACGEQFKHLSRRPTSDKQPYEWCADYTSFKGGGKETWDEDLGVLYTHGDIEYFYEQRGHTPEEAVAKLWLALNRPPLTSL